MLVITVISGYSSTFLLIGSKREQRGLNEPAVRPIQPAQEVVVPQTVYTPDDGVPGIGDPTRGTTTKYLCHYRGAAGGIPGTPSSGV